MFRLVKAKENIILPDRRTMQFCLAPNHSRFNNLHFSNNIYQWHVFFQLLNQAISGTNSGYMDNELYWIGNGIPVLGSDIPDLRNNIPDLRDNIPDLRGNIPDLRGNIPDLLRHNPVLRNDIPDLRSHIPVWGGIFRTW